METAIKFKNRDIITISKRLHSLFHMKFERKTGIIY